MTGWHHRVDGHGFGCTLGFGDEQGGLVFCGSWGHKEVDMTEQLSWTDLNCYMTVDKEVNIFLICSSRSVVLKSFDLCFSTFAH